MKKIIFIFIFLCSSLLFGSSNTIQIRKVDVLLSNQQDIKNRLEFLKEKENYVQELEKRLGKKKLIIDLDEKYKKIEEKYLKKDLTKLDKKKDFLELEKSLYKELLGRIENLEKYI